MQIEHIHNHASSVSIHDFNEKYECDVYIHVVLKWKELPSLYPIHRGYEYYLRSGFDCSIRIRLHSKPQIELKYQQIEALTLFQPSRMRIDITNLSAHFRRNIKYPFISLQLVPSFV